jgi:alpha-1,2-glucosyltransferase
VLGDKENHIASIHIPQMLYIWPYIMFFSWPVIVPHVIHILSGDLDSLKERLPRPIIALPIIFTMALAVHFNTIIHPFTLADNRHYIFYVFRLLILKHPLLKYVAVPIYFVCAWAVIAALGNAVPCIIDNPNANKPPASTEAPPQAIRTSFLLVYLTTTTLSLITAPLVEPRYFILPWLMWRLHLPPPPSQPNTHTRTNSKTIPLLGPILRADPSTWLYLETAWFLLVNLVTCGVFLWRGFEWEQEGGRVQRFMW